MPASVAQQAHCRKPKSPQRNGPGAKGPPAKKPQQDEPGDDKADSARGKHTSSSKQGKNNRAPLGSGNLGQTLGGARPQKTQAKAPKEDDEKPKQKNPDAEKRN